MTSINGHTLFPHNGWASGAPVKWSRTWQSGITTGILGGEQRSALRALPRHKLACDLIARSLQERSRLDARVDAAAKSGLGCLPFFGRGTALLANANAGAVALTLMSASPWTWAAGDYAFLMVDDLTYDVLQVGSVTGGGVTLNTPASTFAWASGQLVWPLLFGKFSCDRENALTNWHGGWSISIEQLAAERNAQLGITPAAAPGVGQQAVGKTNRL